jgi:hypothetical protein
LWGDQQYKETIALAQASSSSYIKLTLESHESLLIFTLQCCKG